MYLIDLRTAILSLVGDDGRVRFSLGTKLALNYLQNRGVELELLQGDRYRLGKAIFSRFGGDDGGYIRADSGGYQVLLNFWGTKANFQQYSLIEVLNGNIKTKHIRDRLGQ